MASHDNQEQSTMASNGLSPFQALFSGGDTSRWTRLWSTLPVLVGPALWVVLTAWWIAGLVLHRHDYGWLIPTLLWLAATLRLVTSYLSFKPVTKELNTAWRFTTGFIQYFLPGKIPHFLGLLGVVLTILLVTLVPSGNGDNNKKNRAISLFGLVVFRVAFYATSRNRKAIKWRIVVIGDLTQFLLALFVLRTKAGFDIVNFIATLARYLLGYAALGFVFLTSEDALQLPYFVIHVIPSIIFFIAFVHLLYWFGWLQWVVKKFAVFFFWTMGVSGAEAVVAAASPFVGQGESAMLIKPFISHLTMAELHQVMASGFATIAGSVLAAYIGMGISAEALISSCVMSIPASIAMSKLRYPETEVSMTAGEVNIPNDDNEDKPTNALHAFAIGSWLGIRIGGMIIAALLCILALLGLVDALLGWFGKYINIPQISVEFICGYLLYPIAFLLGVERSNGDLIKVAKLIGLKVIGNEFLAFNQLATNTYYATLSERSRLIATYALCGFGNISSVGIQIGVLSQLAPGMGGKVAEVAVSALITGVFSTLTSANIAGMLINDSTIYTKVG